MDKISDNNLFDLPLERDDAQAELPGGLHVPGMVPAEDLEIYESVYRLQAHPACHNVIFTDPDETTGEERFENASQWRAILEYPREPLLSEALEWQRYYQARLDAVLWYSLEEHRAKQAAMPKPAVPKPQRASPVR